MRLTSAQRSWLRWAPALFFGAVLARLVWLAWTAASRGVDFTDEGIYLVSYRYYRHPEMVYNGAPAFFGPIFQLFGYSLVALRRVKLILVVISGAGLGWSTAAFAPLGRLETLPKSAAAVRSSFTLFVAIGGFTLYTWLPQSPGYNDLSVLCATAMAALILPILSGRSPWRRWWLIASGVTGAIAFINKWPAGVCVIGVVAVAMVVAHGWRVSSRDAGFVVGLALLAVVGGRFFDRLTELRSASEQLSNALPLWDSYLFPYWHNVADVSRAVGAQVWLVLALGAGFGLVVSARRAWWMASALAVGIALVVRSSYDAGYFRGGTQDVGLAEVALPLFVVIAGVIWIVARVVVSRVAAPGPEHAGSDVPPWRVGAAALVLLVGLAGAQAFGTLNPPMFVIVSSGALCAAVVAVVAVNTVHVWRPALLPCGVLLIAFPLATHRLVASGLWSHPYRLATDLHSQTESLSGVVGYDGLTVDAGTATLLRNLSEIGQRRHLAGRPGLSVSTSPGHTLALGLAHPPADLFVSSSEYFTDNADVYQARLGTACSRGLIQRDDPPVILTAGPTAPADIGALLAECGISYPDDFTLELADSPVGAVGVWIPNGSP
jgi:hypothetical protein